MEPITYAWPFPSVPRKAPKWPQADAGLREEDRDTQALVERYLSLAEEFLSRTRLEPESEPEAA